VPAREIVLKIEKLQDPYCSATEVVVDSEMMAGTSLPVTVVNSDITSSIITATNTSTSDLCLIKYTAQHPV